MQWQRECRNTFYWWWWQARLHGNLWGITSPNEHYNTALDFQNKYTNSQCYSYCSSVNMLNVHQKIIPFSRDCCRKGQKDERQGRGWGHTYAYVHKVIGMTGLCLIISFIHASGKGETRRCQEDRRSWDKVAAKGAGKRNETEQVKWGQGGETTNEEVQPRRVIMGKKYTNARLKPLGAEGCRKGLWGAFVAPFLARGFAHPAISRTPSKPHTIAWMTLTEMAGLLISLVYAPF